MACGSCGRKSEANRVSIATASSAAPSRYQELYDSGDFEVVRYVGPGYTHTIAPVTRAIVKHGMTTYGYGKSGVYFLAHVDDIKAAPNRFVKVEGSELKTALENLGLEAKRQKVNHVETNAEIVNTLLGMMRAVDEVTEEAKSAEDINENPSQSDKLDEPVKDEGKLPLLRATEALPIAEFTQLYGFTHHLQVLAKVRSDELKSYKDEEGKLYVYHLD